MADGDGLAVQERAATALRVCDFAVDRSTRHAQHDLAGAHQCYLRGKHRIFAHEGLGAVDGIHQPQTLGVLVPHSGFLAVKPIGGKACLENLANRDFTAHIGLGHRRFISLDAYLNVVPKQ